MMIKRCKIKKYSAFSIVELAVVVFFMGFFLVLSIGGNRFIERARRQAAIDITKNSPVPYIDDLALWLDASSEKNFTMNDNKTVSVWYDLSDNSNDVVQSTAAKQPKFIYNGMKSFSALQFDGINDFLKIPVNEYSSATTIFIVYKKVGTQANNKSLFSSHDVNTTPGSFQISYYNDKLIIGGRNSVGGVAPQEYFESVANSNLNIISFVADSSNNVKGYLNGSLSFDVDVATGFLPKFNAYKIGINRASDYYFGGYISEVILYNRALYDSERQEVEKYLAKKYNLDI